MQFPLSLMCVVATFGVTLAWYNKMDNEVYGGWLPNRRSPHHCVNFGGHCLKTEQCCGNGKGVVCSLENDGLRKPFGKCRVKAISNYVSPDVIYGLKKSGSPCEDSRECADECCRVMRSRFSSTLSCGKPGAFACATRSANDIDRFGY